MPESPSPGSSPAEVVAPVFLHVGAMKTGTTYLQAVLDGNRERLADLGYLYPGDGWVQQIRAVQDVLSLARNDPRIRREAPGTWQTIVRQMLGHRGAGSIVSMEFLSFADARGARRVVTSLAPADVHVVLGVRDAAATIPAQWQTTVRSGRTISWPDFMKGVRSATRPRARLGRFADPALVKFRRAQDVDRILKVWRRHVPAERLHVVTVPPAGSPPLLLWERFARAVGVDVDGFAHPTALANQSLGYASAELLRQVNARLGKVQLSEYNSTVREHLASGVLAARGAEETPARLDRRTCEFAFEWNRRSRAAVIDSGADLQGDLGDLPTAMTAFHEARLDDAQVPPTDEELLQVAQAAADGMHRLVARRAQRARRRGIVLPAGTGLLAVGPGGGERPGTVAAAVADVAALCREAIDLKRRLDDA